MPQAPYAFHVVAGICRSASSACRRWGGQERPGDLRRICRGAPFRWQPWHGKCAASADRSEGSGLLPGVNPQRRDDQWRASVLGKGCGESKCGATVELAGEDTLPISILLSPVQSLLDDGLGHWSEWNNVRLPCLHSLTWKLEPRVCRPDSEDFLLYEARDLPGPLAREQHKAKGVAYIRSHILPAR